MNQPLSAVPAPADQATADRAASSPAARLLASVRALGPGRLLVLSATALALLAFFAYLILRAIEPPYTLLFGSLELDDSAQIVSRLEALGVPFRLQGDGNAILVPDDQALRLRMARRGRPAARRLGRRRDLRPVQRARHHQLHRQPRSREWPPRPATRASSESCPSPPSGPAMPA